MLNWARSLRPVEAGLVAPVAPLPIANRPTSIHDGVPTPRGGEDGVFLLDGKARVLFANDAGRSILIGDRGLRLRWQSLAAVRAADTGALRRLVAQAERERAGGTLIIAGADGPSLLLVVVPLMTAAYARIANDVPCAMLFARDLEPVAQLSLDAFHRHYRLTPRQADLLREIVKGEGVPAAATRLRISRATARSHLLEIYQKTGARRQAELVSLALRWRGGPASCDLHNVADARFDADPLAAVPGGFRARQPPM
jgi:DNA-binding CsgD family transcriptional regulator